MSRIHLWEAVCKSFARSGSPWVQIHGSVHTKGRVLTTIQSKTPAGKVALVSQWICKAGQKQTPKRVLTGTDPNTGGRKGEKVSSSLAFYNRLFLVPKPNKWRPILDLSQLSLYLAPSSFKMEIPETIRLFLQQGEWVTSLGFSDAYFHILMSQRSQKYLKFHLNSETLKLS